MKILVIGSGGREHALVWSLQKNRKDSLQIFCAPGNAGIAQTARCISISATDTGALTEFAEQEKINLTIVGGEAALAAGLADEFAGRGLSVVGPTQAAARLESSKVFAKDFMARYQIPTARYRVANSVTEARQIIRRGEFGKSVVVKADGLAAGKGVCVARTRAEAEATVESLMNDTTGETGQSRQLREERQRVVLEETLVGREISLLLWTDGRDYRLMPAARDHKRISEGDRGANTGGMGAVTAPDILEEENLNKIVREIVEPTLAGVQGDRLDFRGVMFIGLMMTDEGARVLEYNVRFGDPEAQAILVRLQSDFLSINEAIARRELGRSQIEWSREASACVVLAARGYPEKPETGARIDGLDVAAEQNSNVQVFHAGTEHDQNGEWRTAGGRVLGITATDRMLDRALGNCYATIKGIKWDGMQYRRDIGKSVVQESE